MVQPSPCPPPTPHLQRVAVCAQGVVIKLCCSAIGAANAAPQPWGAIKELGTLSSPKVGAVGTPGWGAVVAYQGGGGGVGVRIGTARDKKHSTLFD